MIKDEKPDHHLAVLMALIDKGLVGEETVDGICEQIRMKMVTDEVHLILCPLSHNGADKQCRFYSDKEVKEKWSGIVKTALLMIPKYRLLTVLNVVASTVSEHSREEGIPIKKLYKVIYDLIGLILDEGLRSESE